MSEAHCNKLPQRKALGLVTHDNTGGPFVVGCQGGGEVYPSFHCLGGEQIADTGDCDDVRCPHCDQVDPHECDNAALAWNTQQLKINELQQRLNAADQRIDDLAAAAEPFAKVADLYAGEEDNSYEPARDVGMHDDLRLTLGQFRALSDLCTRPLMVGCKHGILCGDVTCECKGNGFIERRKVSQPITEQFIEDHLGKMPERIKGMIEARGGKFAIMIDENNGHYGWTFRKDANGMWVSGRKATDAEMHAARTHAHITNQQ